MGVNEATWTVINMANRLIDVSTAGAESLSLPVVLGSWDIIVATGIPLRHLALFRQVVCVAATCIFTRKYSTAASSKTACT